MTVADQSLDYVDVDVMAADLDEVEFEPDPEDHPVMSWARSPAHETRRIWRRAQPPTGGAPFDDQMAYYRGRHTTQGARLTHLVAIPAAVLSAPLFLIRPRAAVVVLAASIAVRAAGHTVFEHNSPAPGTGIVTDQACALAFWWQDLGDRLHEH